MLKNNNFPIKTGEILKKIHIYTYSRSIICSEKRMIYNINQKLFCILIIIKKE